MWNSEPQMIELIKQEGGLRFSILDNQLRMSYTKASLVRPHSYHIYI